MTQPEIAKAFSNGDFEKIYNCISENAILILSV